ncbi:GTPase IMAP family member 6 [Biomphalaria glabrata]|nr:GTPase IMAP family member 6 [Biomphalaria glabrata]
MNTEQSTKLVMEKMTYAISANPAGFHAFLLVVKFGGRFTEEDTDTIDFLKKIFGESFVKDYCILVLTCGDIFQKESEETGQTFDEWCNMQTGIFRELLQECSWRVVLFDNKTHNKEIKKSQIKSLFKMVDRLSFHGHRYTDENFKKAQSARERLMIESKKPMIRQETMTETSLIMQKMHNVLLIEEPKKCLQQLKDLLERTTLVYDNLKSQDKGTGALHDLVKTVESLKTTIQNEISIAKRLAILQEKYTQEKCIAQQELEAERNKWEKERRENRNQVNHLEKKYQEAKAKNDEGFFSTIVNLVSWPLKRLFGWD